MYYFTVQLGPFLECDITAVKHFQIDMFCLLQAFITLQFSPEFGLTFLAPNTIMLYLNITNIITQDNVFYFIL